jgi:hypothetical protein
MGVPITDRVLFKANRPYRFCFVCGAVWQTSHCRVNDGSEKELAQIRYKGQLWAVQHSKTHSMKDHEMFKKYGADAFPEAAKRLVAFGIVNLSQSQEIQHALYESSPMPEDDIRS